MTKESRKQEPRATLAPDVQALLQSNGANLAAFMQAAQTWFQGCVSVSQELAGFAGRRLREDMESSQALMNCRDPQEALRAQLDFARSATQQYLEEANKLMGLTQEIAQECWAPIEECAKQGLETKPKD